MAEHWFGQKKKEYELAVADMNEAIRLKPVAACFERRGRILSDNGDNDNAISDYSEAIRLEGPDCSFLNNRGVAWKRKGEFDNALRDYDAGLKLEPQDVATLFNRGTVYLLQGSYDFALADFEQAIKFDAKFFLAYGGRANSYAGRGEFSKAITDFETSIRLSAKNSDIHSSFALFLASCPATDLRNGTRAFELAMKSRDLAKWKGAAAQDALGAASAELGDWQNAIKWSESAIEANKQPFMDSKYKERLALYRLEKPYRLSSK